MATTRKKLDQSVINLVNKASSKSEVKDNIGEEHTEKQLAPMATKTDIDVKPLPYKRPKAPPKKGFTVNMSVGQYNDLVTRANTEKRTISSIIISALVSHNIVREE